jgi:hypothetical protein
MARTRKGMETIMACVKSGCGGLSVGRSAKQSCQRNDHHRLRHRPKECAFFAGKVHKQLLLSLRVRPPASAFVRSVSVRSALARMCAPESKHARGCLLPSGRKSSFMPSIFATALASAGWLTDRPTLLCAYFRHTASSIDDIVIFEES